MVSDFLDEHDGWLKLSDEQFEVAHGLDKTLKQEARVLLEYGENRDGYWNNEKFMEQVAHTVMNSTRTRHFAL